jgi:hypothetical protein
MGDAEIGRLGVPSAVARYHRERPLTDRPHPDGTQEPGPAYTPGAAPIPPPQPQPSQPQPSQPQPYQPPPNQQPPYEPVNYAPPGYAPDYGPGYQYPGPYPYAPPPPPPRRSNAPLIAVVVAVALLLCGGVATAGVLVVHNVRAKAHDLAKPLTDPTLPDNGPGLPGGGFPTDLPDQDGKQVQVTYEVTGDGPVEILYLPKLGASPTRIDDVKLPWRFSATMETPTLISIIAMRTDSDTGTVSCRALVDGKEVKKATSGDNGYASASCIYFVLD